MSDQPLSQPANPGSGTSAFDSILHLDENGQEYWLARELAKALGYIGPDSWNNFERVLNEARTVAISQSYNPDELFSDAGKKSSGGRPAKDYRLTRLACYMTALSADGNKPEVAAAKSYFAVMTREREELLDLAQQLGDNPLSEIGQRIVRRQELTQAIADVGLGEFRRQMTYKSQWYGNNLYLAHPFFPSTQLCSGCHRLPSGYLDLSMRTYHCAHCGLVLDRDLNAARNLVWLYPASSAEIDACGVDVRPDVLALRAVTLKQEPDAS